MSAREEGSEELGLGESPPAPSSKDRTMKRKHHSAEQIITKLREAERRLAEGETVAQVARALEVSEQTYYRWKRQYGNMAPDDSRRLRELERENERLKKVVAELSLDKAVLREALAKK